MHKYIFIKNPIYPFKFHIFLNIKSIDELMFYIKLRLKKDKDLLRKELLETLPQDLESYSGFSYEFKGNIIVLCKSFDNLPRCWDTLSHEVGHGVFLSARFIGLKYSEDSEEFFTYMLGFVVGKIKTALLKDCKETRVGFEPTLQALQAST